MSGEKAIYRIAFLLLPEFALYGVVAAVEAIRVANSLLAEPAFETILVHDSDHGGATRIRSSGGLELETERHVRDLTDFDALLVCASFRCDAYERAETQSLLRRFARHGKAVGGIESGVYHLAKAGVLNGRVATAHFPNLPFFAQSFPEVRFVRRVYAFEPDRMTCAGGSAPVDLMLRLIAERLGRVTAMRAASLLVYPYRRDGDAFLDDVFTDARSELPLPVREACRIMLEAIDDGRAVARIAAEMNLSRRHLDRLFRKSLGRPAAEHLRMMRLARARKLIKSTRHDLSTIAARCGFASYSHFLKRYKAAFGVTPVADRNSNPLTPAAPERISPLDDLHPYQAQLDPVRML